MSETVTPDALPVSANEARHVIVVGAGLIGLCSALWLQRFGHRVTVVDREPPQPGASYRQACSYGNACTVALHACVPVATPGIALRVPGMLLDRSGPLAILLRHLPRLAPWLVGFVASSSRREVERIASVLGGLLAQAEPAWRPLIAEAGALTHHAGCLYLYKSAAQYHADDEETALRERHGVSLTRLNATDIRELEPHLAPLYQHGILFRDAYTFDDPLALALAIAAAIRARGGSFVTGEATELRPTEHGVAVRVGETELLGDRAVLATGAHSKPLAQRLGDAVLLDTERGYHVLFPQGARLLNRPVCYIEHGFYMTPMAQGLRAAGTVELGGLAAPPQPARTRAIRNIVARLLPDAGEGTSEWLGFRPSMPDSLPVIGAASASSRVTYAFGHGHLGLTLAGVTGKLVAQRVSERAPCIPLEALRADRFRRFGWPRQPDRRS